MIGTHLYDFLQSRSCKSLRLCYNSCDKSYSRGSFSIKVCRRMGSFQSLHILLSRAEYLRMIAHIRRIESLIPRSILTLRRRRVIAVYTAWFLRGNSERAKSRGRHRLNALADKRGAKTHAPSFCAKELKRRTFCLDVDGHLFGDYKGGWISTRIMTQFYNERSEL